jgi:hypothetical protein
MQPASPASAARGWSVGGAPQRAVSPRICWGCGGGLLRHSAAAALNLQTIPGAWGHVSPMAWVLRGAAPPTSQPVGQPRARAACDHPTQPRRPSRGVGALGLANRRSAGYINRIRPSSLQLANPRPTGSGLQRCGWRRNSKHSGPLGACFPHGLGPPRGGAPSSRPV